MWFQGQSTYNIMSIGRDFEEHDYFVGKYLHNQMNGKIQQLQKDWK